MFSHISTMRLDRRAAEPRQPVLTKFRLRNLRRIAKQFFPSVRPIVGTGCCKWLSQVRAAGKTKRPPFQVVFCFGAPPGTRTLDPCICRRHIRRLRGNTFPYINRLRLTARFPHASRFRVSCSRSRK